jgi:hypothetical protein
MAIIYTYPTKTNPVGSDLILISDSADSNKTKQVKVSSLPSSGGGSVSSVGLSLSGIAAFTVTGDNPITSSGTIVLGTTGGSAGQFLDYQGNWATPVGISSVTSANTAITIADSTTAPVLTSAAYSGGNNIGHVPTGGSGTTYLKGDGTWGTPSGGGSSLAILNEGTDITAAATSINFVGSGVTATAATNAVTVTIPDAFVIEDVQYSVSVAKGDALYISGPAHGSGRPTVGIADATAQQAGNEKYPVVGLALADYSSGEGKMIVTGILDDFNTNNITNPVIGQPIYVDNSGTTENLTGTKPIGTDVIQNVAIVNKTGANGSLQVSCIGRTNDLPNLEQGKIWLGDANGVPSALTIGSNTAVLTSNGTTASWSTIPATNLVNGVSGVLGVSNGGTNNSDDPVEIGSIMFGNASEDGYETANGFKYLNSSLTNSTSSTTLPSGYFTSNNATIVGTAGASYSASIGAVNIFNPSTVSGSVPLVVGSSHAQGGLNASRLITFYGGSSGGPGSFRCGDIFSDSSALSMSLSNASDYRLKENVSSIEGSTVKINALNPVNYNIIGQATVVEGFLAHELQEQFPNAVIGDKDALDVNGDIDPQMVDYTKVIPALVGAIKELTARIEALEA